MKSITAEEFELLSFFEVEPQQSDPGIPWPYNDYSYAVELGSYAVRFGIQPAYRDLSFTVSHGDEEIYSFSALSVKDVRYQKNAQQETLEIIVTDRETLVLQLRPFVRIVQRVANDL